MTEQQKQQTIDIFWKKYELNEACHDRKERMAWVGSTIYYTFSLAILTWLAGAGFKCTETLYRPILTIFVSMTFISALTFTSLQFYHRWKSVSESGAHERILKRLQSENGNKTYQEFIDEDVDDGEKRKLLWIMFLTIALPILIIFGRIKCKRKKCKEFIDSRYRTEIPTYTIATILFAAQLVMIWSCKIRNIFQIA